MINNCSALSLCKKKKKKVQVLGQGLWQLMELPLLCILGWIFQRAYTSIQPSKMDKIMLIPKDSLIIKQYNNILNTICYALVLNALCTLFHFNLLLVLCQVLLLSPFCAWRNWGINWLYTVPKVIQLAGVRKGIQTEEV